MDSLASVKAFIFDFTGTIYDIDSDLEAHRRLAHYLVEKYELDVTPDSLHQTANRLIALYLRSLKKGEYLSGSQIMKGLWRRLCTVFGLPSTQSALEDFIETTKSYHLYYAQSVPGANALLQKLKERGYELALVSQIDEELLQLILEELELNNAFDVVVSAEQVAKARPDPAVIAAAVEELGLEPGKIAMVGDDSVCDVDPAASLGLKTVLFDDELAGAAIEGRAEPDFRIQRLLDLLALTKN